jgi:hypothetical protein
MRSLPLLFLLILAVGSCDDALDLVPRDRVDLDILYETPSDAEAGLVGAYQPMVRVLMQDLMLNLSLSAYEFYDARRGLANRPVGYRPALRIGNDGGSGNIWVQGYIAISRVNLLLERVPDIADGLFAQAYPDNPDRKAEILAEAKFIRAYTYYNLVLLYGDVPLLLEFPASSDPAENQVPRTPAEQVWDQIRADLTDAAADLPWNHLERIVYDVAGNPLDPIINSKGRATRGTALLLLSRLHLRFQEWQAAADRSLEVIENDGSVELAEDWTRIFSNSLVDNESQLSPESLWELPTFRDGFNNVGGYFFRVQSPTIVSATPAAYNFFEGDSLDLRQGFSMTPSQDQPDLYIRAEKFTNRDGGYGTPDPFNFIVFRLGEAYLIRAEALNELGYPNAEAFERVNTIRARTAGTFNQVDYPGVVPFTPDSLTTQEALRQGIRDERWRELMFEGVRFYDLLRYDGYDGGARALVPVFLDDPSVEGADPGKILLPIPDRDIRLNPALTQNPAYN